MKSFWFWTAGALVVSLAVPVTPAAAQDYMQLRINEVMGNNTTTIPDFNGGTPDVLELYNPTDLPIDLEGLALSDTLTIEEAEAKPDGGLYEFREGRTVPGTDEGGWLTIFCDGQTELDCIEPHASFRIDEDGNEPISLWGPDKGDGTRDLIDQVWLPPLRSDVSFQRVPDGEGPAPVPLEQTFDVFFFSQNPSFGSCNGTSAECTGIGEKRNCFGEPNEPATNLSPRVSRKSHSTNAPAAGVAVEFEVRVRDDKPPVPPNIASVEIIYRTSTSGATSDWMVEPMEFDATQGVDGLLTSADEGRPLDRFSIWTGSIPGQDAGTGVEFFFRVEDAEGASATRPLEMCAVVLTDEPVNVCDVQIPDAEDVGPCDSQFGGPGCVKTGCDPNEYIPCEKPLAYVVGYEPQGALASLVVNEIVAGQFNDPNAPENPQHGILQDPTSRDPSLCGFFEERTPKYCCLSDAGPDCGYNDYVELYNGADEEIDLSNLWLSDSYFSPRTWKFPAGSVIGPKEHLIVWCDDDGGKCPDINRPVENMPNFWECPDPNDPAAGEFHTSFELNGDNDQIFILEEFSIAAGDGFDGFGLVHGAAFRDQVDNVALSLCPDGDPSGTWVPIPDGSPAAPNSCLFFIRGDTNNSGIVDLSDGVATLDYLFRGADGPDCEFVADANSSGLLDLSDAVFTFAALFTGGPLPLPPFPGCGVSEDPEEVCPTHKCNE